MAPKSFVSPTLTSRLFITAPLGKPSSALENANAEASMNAKVRRKESVPTVLPDSKLGHLVLHGNCREAEEQERPSSILINQSIIYLSFQP